MKKVIFALILFFMADKMAAQYPIAKTDNFLFSFLFFIISSLANALMLQVSLFILSEYHRPSVQYLVYQKVLQYSSLYLINGKRKELVTYSLIFIENIS